MGHGQHLAEQSPLFAQNSPEGKAQGAPFIRRANGGELLLQGRPFILHVLHHGLSGFLLMYRLRHAPHFFFHFIPVCRHQGHIHRHAGLAEKTDQLGRHRGGCNDQVRLQSHDGLRIEVRLPPHSRCLLLRHKGNIPIACIFGKSSHP